MFILIVGSRIRHCLLQLGSKNSLLTLFSLSSSTFFYVFLLLYKSINFFFINLCLESLMFLYLVLMETGEKN